MSGMVPNAVLRLTRKMQIRLIDERGDSLAPVRVVTFALPPITDE